MPAYHLIGDGQVFLAGAVRALDAWFIADALHPLVSTHRSVTGSATLGAGEPPRIYLLPPTE